MNRIMSAIVSVAVLLALASTAMGQLDLRLPDEVWGDMWVFRDLCPMGPSRPADPLAVTGFRYDMLDLDPGDDFYFTWVAIPRGFGWDGMGFSVSVDDTFIDFVTPADWPVGVPAPPPGAVAIPPTKSFTITGIPIGFLDPLDPDDQRIFPFWVGWTPSVCGADIGVTPIPEPATLSLLVLGGLALIRRRHAP